MSDVIEKAIALLQMDPLPDDAEDQMEALAEQADTEEKFMFERLFEGLFAKRCSNPDTIPLEPSCRKP